MIKKVECSYCFQESEIETDKKKVERFMCDKCKISSVPYKMEPNLHAMARNYPLEYWENQ